MAEADLPQSIRLCVPDANDPCTFYAIITPDEGYYRRGSFQFLFSVKPTYPHDPPRVRCLSKIYHPNIDTEGNVCLNILREDWKPVLSISAIIYGLLSLFLDPNPEDPLNKSILKAFTKILADAATVLKNNPRLFGDYVSRSMRGGVVEGVEYEYVMGTLKLY